MAKLSPKKVLLIVMDSVGCGAAPDAHRFGDEDCDTLGNISKEIGGLELPNLRRLGLGNLHKIQGCPPDENPIAHYGVLQEASMGKDTTTGHWEMMGLVLKEEFPVFKNGFPPEILDPFIERTGRQVLGNKPSSGTVILDELGPKQEKTGKWIVYTSGDSVFQIAAHEKVIPLDELYKACEIAREILDPYKVGRVIARPYIGEAGNYQRTYNRHDYSMLPPNKTALDFLIEGGIKTYGVGKIKDIFAGIGIEESIHTEGNKDGVDKTIELSKKVENGLIFVNLVDFDSKYGHRNNVEGYAKALRKFDARLPELLDSLDDGDWLMLTADHGCDPTYKASTDHSREFVPWIFYTKGNEKGVNLGLRSSFCDIGQTILDGFNLPKVQNGVSALVNIQG